MTATCPGLYLGVTATCPGLYLGGEHCDSNRCLLGNTNISLIPHTSWNRVHHGTGHIPTQWNRAYPYSMEQGTSLQHGTGHIPTAWNRAHPYPTPSLYSDSLPHLFHTPNFCPDKTLMPNILVLRSIKEIRVVNILPT